MSYFDRAGRPITQHEWAESFENEEYQRVAADNVDGHYVSTVWLGLNHQWDDRRPPLIFETMIFCESASCVSLADGCPLDDWQCRYSTEPAARAGHDDAIAEVRREMEARAR